MMVVKNNMTAVSSLNTLNKNTNELAKQLQQVSTGMKINSAADAPRQIRPSVRMGLADMRCESLGLKKSDGTTVSVVTQSKANSAITVVDRALNRAIKQQITVGAMQVRLNFAAANLSTAHENVTASESVIRDADMAKAFTSYTRANVLLQTSQSMLAQANQNSNNVLGLLQ